MTVPVLLIVYVGLVTYRKGIWSRFAQAADGSLTVGGRS